MSRKDAVMRRLVVLLYLVPVNLAALTVEEIQLVTEIEEARSKMKRVI